IGVPAAEQLRAAGELVVLELRRVEGVEFPDRQVAENRPARRTADERRAEPPAERARFAGAAAGTGSRRHLRNGHPGWVSSAAPHPADSPRSARDGQGREPSGGRASAEPPRRCWRAAQEIVGFGGLFRVFGRSPRGGGVVRGWQFGGKRRIWRACSRGRGRERSIVWMIGLETLLASAVGAWLVTPLVVRLAGRVGALDAPGPRKVHQSPIPRIGGLSIFAGVVAGIVVAAIASGYVKNGAW